ncbi:hypothetical protein VCJ_003076 [Vibrio metoecus]|nr:hypothetical protein VCJ_003076 [Vibrio metoecus]
MSASQSYLSKLSITFCRDEFPESYIPNIFILSAKAILHHVKPEL